MFRDLKEKKFHLLKAKVPADTVATWDCYRKSYILN